MNPRRAIDVVRCRARWRWRIARGQIARGRTFRWRSTMRGMLCAAALAIAGTTSACRDSLVALGSSPAAARANASGLFGAIADRFTNVQRTPRFAAARPKLAKHALTPTGVFGDTTIWTSASGDSIRTITVAGAMDTSRHYVMDARTGVPMPVHAGDSRHVIQLRHLAESDYEWLTHVDLATGSILGNDVARYFTATIASVASVREPDLRADYRAAIPRTAHALARLWSLDTIRRQPNADGSTNLTAIATMHANRLRSSGFPAFASYVERYLDPARARFIVTDPAGARWFDIRARRDTLTVRLRVAGDGRLMSLDATPRRGLPDTLQLHMDLIAHIRFFDVGASDIVGDVIETRTPEERGWTVRFAKEPFWHLPLFTEHLLRAPLRRPFEGEGIVARIGVRNVGSRSTLTREMRLAVRESAILRWLGALGFAAMNDFAGQAESEENRFIAEVFQAMAADAGGVARTAASGESGY